MSELAQSFLERWTEENVAAVAAVERESEAERLAAACKEDAEQEGITEEELDEACVQSSDEEHSDIFAFMLAALERVSGSEDDDDLLQDEEDDG